jgi:hypothetical protein
MLAKTTLGEFGGGDDAVWDQSCNRLKPQSVTDSIATVGGVFPEGNGGRAGR